MAENQKLSDLPEVAIVTPSDYLPIVPLGATVTKKVQLASILALAGGGTGGGSLPIVTAPPNDYTLTLPALLFLPDTTADATLTLPSPILVTGQLFPICNQNTSASKWLIAGNVVDATGTAVTEILSGTTIMLISFGVNYLLIQGGTSSTPINNKLPYTLPFNLS